VCENSSWLACFFFLLLERKGVEKKNQIYRSSVSDIIYLLMSNTGMSRDQAAVTLEGILQYMKHQSKDPLAKLSRYIFGMNEDKENASLN